MCGTKAEPSCWEHVRVPSSRNNRSPAGVKIGEKLSIFPPFAQRGVNGRREAAFFETWLTRILLNTCHRELRRRNRFHPGGEDALPDTAGPDAYDSLPLREAVGRLPEELRAVVILRFFTGYTQSETAQALGIPQGTVATRQRKALALLRLELGEEDGA